MRPRQQLLNLAQQWAPPPGLDRSRPRPVRFTAGGWALAVLSAALVVAGFAAGIALFSLASGQEREALQLRARGIDTDAIVTRLWTSDGEDPQRFVAFQFDAGGQRLEGRQRIPHGVWSGLRVGSTIPVRYDPSDPLVHVPFGGERQRLSHWTAFVAALTLMALGAVASVPLRSQRRLLVEGRPAPALVTRRSRNKSTEGGSHYQIEYEFVLLSGAARTGRSAGGKMHEGQLISVLYEPDDPARNAPYPFSLVRLDTL
jgi:hypothetical protein